MVEYGHGVSQSTGHAAGTHAAQGGDAGAAAVQALGDAVNTVASLPPETLLLGFVVIVLGFMLLKRAF